MSAALGLDTRVYNLEQNYSQLNSAVASIQTMQSEQGKDTARLDQRITDLIKTLGALAVTFLTLAVAIAGLLVTVLS